MIKNLRFVFSFYLKVSTKVVQNEYKIYRGFILNFKQFFFKRLIVKSSIRKYAKHLHTIDFYLSFSRFSLFS